ncbi:MAG: hypothetical protein F4X95_03770 [Oligoflexia bacterium]|nr:hypothetical protein [Oligoflexia bacterium]
MKKIFSKITKRQILISLGYVLCMGLYTGAEPSQQSEKTDNAKMEAAAENQKSPENEKTSAEQNPAEKIKQPMPTMQETDKSEENDNQAEKTKQPVPAVKETANPEKDKVQKDKSQAEQIKTPVPPIVNETADTKTKEPKKEENLVEVIKQPELFVNKVIHSRKAKRNGFATFYITPDFNLHSNEFSLMIQAGLGKIIDLPNLISTGLLEGELGFNGLIKEEEQTLSLQLKTEINFIRNNGINNLIPGMDVPLILSINGLGRSFSRLYFNIGTGMYLKAFMSKDFALIPRLGIKLNLQASGFGYLKERSPTVSLELGLGLRRYF